MTRVLIGRLHELIEALDRRVPRRGAAGEVGIAREALLLRQKALRRIAEIEAGDRAGGGA